MTPQEASALWPIIKAFSEGQEVEVMVDGVWRTVRYPTFDGDLGYYRIKPAPQYRPYTYEEIKDQILAGRQWVRHIQGTSGYSIVAYHVNAVDIHLGVGLTCVPFATLLQNYVWVTDESPCGKII